MASMLAAAVAAALAVYVAFQAVRGMRASLPIGGEAQMTRQEARGGIWMCACAVLLSLFLAAFACYVALVPGATAQMEAGSGIRLAVTTAGGLLVSILCIRETARLSGADRESGHYRMREVPLVYAAFLWSALSLGYAVALA